uniref:Uncharacterized protein n=1 Tax=Pithovirus LCPAC001 TaxID=2506585 RepID=A0A481Z2U2_9VIRU|nr:MAG: hypothetical protein LCPAC001_01710 [Pithovirus LCPAC001]
MFNNIDTDNINFLAGAISGISVVWIVPYILRIILNLIPIITVITLVVFIFYRYTSKKKSTLINLLNIWSYRQYISSIFKTNIKIKPKKISSKVYDINSLKNRIKELGLLYPENGSGINGRVLKKDLVMCIEEYKVGEM